MRMTIILSRNQYLLWLIARYPRMTLFNFILLKIAPVQAMAQSRRLAQELTAIIERRGKPGMIVSDHGTELTSNAILSWCADHQIKWHCNARRQ